MHRSIRGLVTLALLLTSLWATAETRLTPSWMTIDKESRTVEMEVVAGFNINNNNWNFNGYYDGNMTAVVPAGWKVRITFSSIDGNYPHSLVVIDDPGAPDNLPTQAGREQVAIRRAYSRDPLGGIYNEEDTLRFSVDEAGDYLWFCGVPGHGLGGMWVYFRVSDTDEEPYITLTDDADGRT